MLRSIKSLRGYSLRATDGKVGKSHGFYFDDQTWTVRYLVVDTGTWLLDRLVLLSTASLGNPEWERKVFPVGLTMEQVEKSPSISVDEPVSRQMEVDLHGYYGWHPYWHGPAYIAAAQGSAQKRDQGDPHLRSTREVIGYHIQTTDGEIGHVDDFVVDDEAWVIRYVVVDTQNWLPGKKVLIAPQWIADVDWAGRRVSTDLAKDAIENGPEFDPSLPVNREYEVRLYDYYGRPHYWMRVQR
jgi:hypothetical protein